MKSKTVSIGEGKKGLIRLIQDALGKKENIIITKMKKPVAVIVPYDEYRRSRRLEGYKKILESRETFSRRGIRADEVCKESKEQLEKRP